MQLEKEPRKELLGWIIAAHPIGQLVFSPLIGYLCTFLGSIRLPSIFCLLVFLLSSLWYAFLPLHETNAQYFMVVSRVLAGVSAGQLPLFSPPFILLPNSIPPILSGFLLP